MVGGPKGEEANPCSASFSAQFATLLDKWTSVAGLDDDQKDGGGGASRSRPGSSLSTSLLRTDAIDLSDEHSLGKATRQLKELVMRSDVSEKTLEDAIAERNRCLTKRIQTLQDELLMRKKLIATMEECQTIQRQACELQKRVDDAFNIFVSQQAKSAATTMATGGGGCSSLSAGTGTGAGVPFPFREYPVVRSSHPLLVKLEKAHQDLAVAYDRQSELCTQLSSCLRRAKGTDAALYPASKDVHQLVASVKEQQQRSDELLCMLTDATSQVSELLVSQTLKLAACTASFIQHIQQTVDARFSRIRLEHQSLLDELLFLETMQQALPEKEALLAAYEQQMSSIDKIEEESMVLGFRLKVAKSEAAKRPLRAEVESKQAEKRAKMLDDAFLALKSRLFQLSHTLPELSTLRGLNPLLGTCAEALPVLLFERDYKVDGDVSSKVLHARLLSAKEEKVADVEDDETNKQKKKKDVDVHVALKKFALAPGGSVDHASASEDWSMLRHLANLYVQVRHPHIIELQAVAVDLASANAFLQFPYFPAGDMRRLVDSTTSIASATTLTTTSEKTIKLLRSIAQALQFLHDAGLVHRDVKPDNVLLKEDGTAVLADLDIARITDDKQITPTATIGVTVAKGELVGTREYFAPELKQALMSTGNIPYSPSSDMYAFGVLCSELLTGKRVYTEKELPLLTRSASSASDSKPTDRKVLTEIQSSFLQRLLCADPSRRMTAAQALEHDYLRGSLVCMVCLDAVSTTDALLCAERHSGAMAATSEPHALCRDCFESLVVSESSKDLGEMKKHQGRIKCPKCTNYYSASTIATTVGSLAFAAYQRVQTQLEAARVTSELEAKFRRELEQALKMEEKARRVHLGRLVIVNDILNLCCPRCKAVFVDFSGCFALTCSQCNCGFCAWCLTDCGDNAHPHVRSCNDNVMPGRNVYGDLELWKRTNSLRRRARVMQYLTGTVRDRDVARSILRECARELRDVNIDIKEFDL
jgi:serine/threonine protein kinase